MKNSPGTTSGSPGRIPTGPWSFIFANLPNIVKDEEPVEETDIVLWATSAVHHEPRHEDGKPGSGPRLWPGDDAWEGSALVMWSGFDLRPRNFFDRTPFYPYPPAPPAVPRTATSTSGRKPRPGGNSVPWCPGAAIRARHFELAFSFKQVLGYRA